MCPELGFGAREVVKYQEKVEQLVRELEVRARSGRKTQVAGGVPNNNAGETAPPPP